MMFVVLPETFQVFKTWKVCARKNETIYGLAIL